jgi:hypothetical protein
VLVFVLWLIIVNMVIVSRIWMIRFSMKAMELYEMMAIIHPIWAIDE